MPHTLGSISLYLLGCGKMGSALLKSWLAGGISPMRTAVQVGTRETAADLRTLYGVNASATFGYTGQDVVVIAVKPQILADVIRPFTNQAQPLYISTAAGLSLASLQRLLGPDARIIRAMPNTPAELGKGMTTLVAGKVKASDKTVAEALFKASGKILWLKNEEQMAVATAIAGSGPAYFFHFAESLIGNAMLMGLGREEATLLVSQTLAGSVALAEAGNWDVSTLRKDVTSTAGVTEAALKVLMPALTPLLEEALKANIARGRALTKG